MSGLLKFWFLSLSAALLSIVAAAGALYANAAEKSAAGKSQPLVLKAVVDNEAITPGTARYIVRAIAKAEEEHAECLVVVLDTPGGLLDSTRTIVKAMLASRTCVVVYVAPSGSRAASAGVFITLAGNVAAMAPGTTIGAAHPVQVGGLPIQPQQQPSPTKETGEDKSEKKEETRPQSVMEEKIVNDTVAWARTLAEERHRNADWAARAVKESVSVTASVAVKEGVVDFEAADMAQLIEKLDGREVTLATGPHTLHTAGARVEEVPMWWGERLLTVLGRPNVAFLLLLFGFYGILFELYTPGWGVSGTLGIICLLLAMFGLAVLPVNYLGLTLIVLAMGMFVAEAFVTSFGALAVAGIVCLVLGGLMLVDSPVGFARVSLGVVVPMAAATAAITLLLVGNVVRTYRGRVQTGDEGMVGLTARAGDDFARDDGRYTGTVLAHGEWWNAMSEQPIAAGQTCRVQQRQNLTLIVRAAESETPAPGDVTSIPPSEGASR